MRLNPLMFMVVPPLIVVLCLLLDVLVQQRAPVHDEQPVRVVLRARHPFELSGCDQFAHQDVAPAFDALPSVVGELHFGCIESDAVAEDGEHRACSENVAVETFLFERIILCQSLCQSGLVHQVHGLLHRVTDVLVIRRKGEKVMVDFLLYLCK